MKIHLATNKRRVLSGSATLTLSACQQALPDSQLTTEQNLVTCMRPQCGGKSSKNLPLLDIEIVRPKNEGAVALARMRWSQQRPPENPHTIGDRLRVERMAKGWTLATLSDKSGISPATLGHYERNAFKPPFAKLNKLCEVLDITLPVLLGPDDGHA